MYRWAQRKSSWRPSQWNWLDRPGLGGFRIIKNATIVRSFELKKKIVKLLLAPSGAQAFIMVYYIPAAARPLFSNFSDSSDSKVLKRPNMWYIFEKHGIQGYQILYSRVSNVKYTNTQINKNKALKRPYMCYIFEKHGIQEYQIWHSRESNVKYTNTQIHFNTNMQIHKVLKRPHMCYIFEKHGIQRYQTWHSHVLNVKYTFLF